MGRSSFAKKSAFVCTISIITCLVFAERAHAWGKRGHSIVCQTAAYLLADQPKNEFLKMHSFDLGYYCNVPDLVWKRPETYQQESFNHFMDMEIFEREIKPEDLGKAFALDRVAFNAKYPKIPDKAGRSFWRIRELLDGTTKITEQLKSTALTDEDRRKIQGDWLVHLGAAGHYIGDLAQPLHVTENYDGNMNDQKGVHVWFEDDAVDELFHAAKGPGLESEVMAAAEKKWKKLKSGWEKESVLSVIEALAKTSNADLKELYAIDKKVGRKDIKKAAEAFHNMIVDRMSTGAVAIAKLWSHNLGWEYSRGKKITGFISDPPWIAFPLPPAPQPAPL